MFCFLLCFSTKVLAHTCTHSVTCPFLRSVSSLTFICKCFPHIFDELLHLVILICENDNCLFSDDNCHQIIFEKLIVPYTLKKLCGLRLLCIVLCMLHHGVVFRITTEIWKNVCGFISYTRTCELNLKGDTFLFCFLFFLFLMTTSSETSCL